MSQNCNEIGSNNKANSRAVERFDSAALGRCNRSVALDCTRAARAARTNMWNEENSTIVLPLIVLVVVGRIHEDGTHQDVYLVGVVFDADSVAVEDAPLLADLANLDVALQDGKVPAHAIALDFVVVVTGDVDVDLFLGGHAPVFLLGGRPEFAVLEPFVVVPRGDRGCICLLQATQFFPANGLERSLVSPLERIALDLVDRATVLGDPVVVGDELELLFEMKFLNHFWSKRRGCDIFCCRVVLRKQLEIMTRAGVPQNLVAKPSLTVLCTFSRIYQLRDGNQEEIRS